MVMISSTGRRPRVAAPIPMPMKPSSEMGVSRTRLGPNSWKRPSVTLDGVRVTSPISSPMTITRSSRAISSRRACCSAWR